MSIPTNPFATAEPWGLNDGGGILPPGDHVVTVKDIETGTSSGGHPQIIVSAGNDNGSARDWIVVIPTTLGRVTQLSSACGVPIPQDDEVTPEGTGFRLSESYLEKFVGKQVGVRMHQEPDRLDPQKMRDRVSGWCPAADFIGSDVPSNGAAAAFAPPVTDDIPF